MEAQKNEKGIRNTVNYDREKKGYRLEKICNLKHTNREVLAICMILLDSRAFTEKEMGEILKKLIECCVPRGNQRLVNELISNEVFHYIELQHQKEFIDTKWELGQAIQYKIKPISRLIICA